jgi:hypothetical protein
MMRWPYPVAPLLTASVLVCAAACTERNPHRLDDVLTLSNVQAKGTHNSYHVAPEDPAHPSWDYTQPSLTEQLERWGVRQFELDLHYRDGHGLEVFHAPLVDEETTCFAFRDCLAELEAWSAANRWHLPLVVWIEPKDLDALDETLIPITGRIFEIEDEILGVFPRERVFMPDDLRRGHVDLPAAIAADGWPTLGVLRGKVIFALLNRHGHRDDYLDGAPALEGRVMFVAAASRDEPSAAFFKIDNAQAEGERIRGLVEAGFVVTSNVDSADASDEENAARLEASMAAGVHFGSTDFPAPVADRAYWFEMADGTPARCNPIFVTEGCTAEDVERLP